jgi:short-subunit dehydrogenase
MLRKIGWTVAAVGATVGAAFAMRTLIRSVRSFHMKDRVVVIAGGSRGLGLVLARQLAAQGAKIALLSRDELKLREAARQLDAFDTEVSYHVCDIRNEAQVQSTVASVLARFGKIDVLINDAGIIQVGPLDTMTPEDFKNAMETHFYGPLYLTMTVLPHMRKQKFGRIANISSIGGKIAVPHLLPYDASKFALVGLSEGLRAELMKDNVLVTTVCPGMMRTGSHINAEFKGNNRGEFAWFSIGNSLPVTSVSAEKAARQIIDAIRRGDAELIISIQAQAAAKFNALFPGLTADLLGLVNMLLPRANPDQKQITLGRDSKSWASPSVLTKLSDLQIRKNNEQ